MPRYAIYGIEKPEIIEEIVTEALKELGLFQVHYKGELTENSEWDRLILYCTPRDEFHQFWVDLRVHEGNPRKHRVWDFGANPLTARANFELTLSPKGYGSAVEAETGYVAGRLDDLCKGLRPKLPNAQFYKSHGVGGTEMRPLK